VSLSLNLVTALVALSSLLIGLTFATSARKLHRALQERRQERLAALVRPQLLRLIADDALDPQAAQGLTRAAGDKLEDLAVSLLSKLRGADRAALVAFLDQRGVIESARRRTRRRGAVGRARAAELLGAIGELRASDDLIRLLGDRDEEGRAVAARALGKLGDASAVPHLLATLDAARPIPASIVTMALVRLGLQAADTLRESLGTGSERARVVAAELLGPLGAVSAADDLVEAAYPGNPLNLRVVAARSLGRLGLQRTLVALGGCLHEQEPAALRLVAATAIGEIGGATAVTMLLPLLGSPDDTLARIAAAGLAKCGPGGHEALHKTGAGTAGAARAAREAIGGLKLAVATRRRPLPSA
jgi:HEAT repeat protein